MQNAMQTIRVVATLTLVTLLVAGCQMPGQTIAAKSSDTCPSCQQETKTLPIKGLTYTKHVCPSCEDTDIFDDYSENPLYPMGTVHTCSRCETIVEQCEQCRKR